MDIGRIISISLTLIALAFTSCSTDSATYSVGDTGPAGGLIFYDKGSYSDGWRYLEAASSDIGSPTQYLWGGEVTGATSLSIGAGANNTAVIVATIGDPGYSYAAKLCDDLISGGYSDWFLPSKYELQLMYASLHFHTLGDFITDKYWSSTEDISDGNYAYWLDFYDDIGEGAIKSDMCYVRAARRF